METHLQAAVTILVSLSAFRAVNHFSVFGIAGEAALASASAMLGWSAT